MPRRTITSSVRIYWFEWLTPLTTHWTWKAAAASSIGNKGRLEKEIDSRLFRGGYYSPREPFPSWPGLRPLPRSLCWPRRSRPSGTTDRIRWDSQRTTPTGLQSWCPLSGRRRSTSTQAALAVGYPQAITEINTHSPVRHKMQVAIISFPRALIVAPLLHLVEMDRLARVSPFSLTIMNFGALQFVTISRWMARIKRVLAPTTLEKPPSLLLRAS